jgi:hypothetical protein
MHTSEGFITGWICILMLLSYAIPVFILVSAVVIGYLYTHLITYFSEKLARFK